MSGAINPKSQLDKITELVASGVAEGAELYQLACDPPDRGYFFRPTLFTNVAQSHRIAPRRDLWAGSLQCSPSGHWTRPPSRPTTRSMACRPNLDGQGLADPRDGRKDARWVVWANTFNRFDPTSPFGGYKESGFGREGGLHGLLAYVRLEDR